MNKEKQWYILYTHTGSELKVLNSLRRRHFECFCLMSIAAPEGKDKSAAIPLLPNYLFVHVLPEEHTAIRHISGVINFMYWLGEHIIIKEEDISIIKTLEQNYRILTAERISVNTKISTTSVWDYEHVDNSDMYGDADFVKISFPAYGFTITAKENKMNVRVINTTLKKIQQGVEEMQYSK